MEEKYKLMLFSNGLMSELYRAGFIGVKPFLYRDIYLWTDMQIKCGKTRIEAIRLAESYFDTSKKTVKRAMKSFE